MARPRIFKSPPSQLTLLVHARTVIAIATVARRKNIARAAAARMALERGLQR
jgi:hypothetical protein